MRTSVPPARAVGAAVFAFILPALAHAAGPAPGLDASKIGAEAPLAAPAPVPAPAPAGAAVAAGETVVDGLTITIAPAQQTLTLGTDTGTTVLVTLSGRGADEAIPGRTSATVGSIDLLTRRSPGAPPAPPTVEFSAQYHVPQDRRPQCAIIAVEFVLASGRRAHAITHLLLPAATDFPLLTSPFAAVSLEVAGQVFGPRKADAAGNVRIPIVVPPNVAKGQARAVNRFGVAKETEVDLQPQDYPRVLLMVSAEVQAGVAQDIEVWAVEPSGALAPPEDIDLRASAGKIRRLGGIPGTALFSFTPPGKLGPGNADRVQLAASMADGTSSRAEELIVRAGPAANLALTVDVPRFVVASKGVGQVAVVASDQFGNAIPTNGVRVSVDGRPLATQATEAGGVTTVIHAPDVWQGRDHMAIEAVLGGARSVLEVPVTGGAPARVTLSAGAAQLEANGSNGVELALKVVDERGTPTSASRVAWQTDDDGTIESLPSPGLGTYTARFSPRVALRDRSAAIAVTIAPNLTASTRVVVLAGASRTVAARIGVASNLGSFFGQTAFIETTLPLRRFARFGRLARLLSAGVSIGYVHSELTTSGGTALPGVHIDVSQAPILALARMRVPGDLPVEISLSGMTGVTFATTSLTPTEDAPFGASRATARALLFGLGVDCSLWLQPGELVIGLRYLHANLGRNSNGDEIAGNSIGVIGDLGFRVGF